MSKAPRHPPELGQPRSSAPILDKYAIVPISACVFALIVSPLLAHFLQKATSDTDYQARIFWPAMAAISVIFALRNPSRLGRLIWSPHILCLFACLAFAGASVLWAFKPESSFIRFVQQVMVVTSIVLPALLADRRADMMRALFLCFAFASILNVFFVLSGDQMIAQYGTRSVNIGYSGYFLGKNYLGECATVALLLSLHEMLYPGLRRALGIIVMAIAIFLVIVADSKTALGLAIVTPFLAGLTLIAAKKMRLSPSIILLSIPLCYAVLSSVSNFNVNRLSYILYGDSTLTGRTIIWDFASYEIAQRPLFGWGYQSFWLVGPDAPSVVDAPGWVKRMPNAHNGYYDTTLEMGYVGYSLLVIFIIATLQAIGRVAYRDPTRAWLVLSLALYIICFNYLESLWMRGFEFLWVVFLIIAAEIGRDWQPLPQKGAAYGSTIAVPGRLRPLQGAEAGQETLGLSSQKRIELKMGSSEFGTF
jgi:exopolysaccharide production protein ExoQ